MPPGPLRDRFPGGFDDLANALFPYVSGHPELGLDPAQAVKGGLAELLGIPIDNYVLVDMVGFMQIIDALGGVTVNLSTNVAPGAEHRRRRRRRRRRSARAR